jgi:radical SAM superfamily enzyme YgiQ (UPF0313 family)
MRQKGDILLVSCYELGHQPLGLAMPLGFFEAAGFRPDVLDVSRESVDPIRLARARMAAISTPMHTALRLGVQVADHLRRVNPAAHICFHGLYASLNADHLLRETADSILAGECEESLVDLARALERGGDLCSVAGLGLPGGASSPVLKRLSFVTPRRDGLRSLTEYAALEEDGRTRVAGYVEASRGCLHHCRHCPIPPVYGGRFFVVPKEQVLEDIGRQAEMGATHITFGDPDFLNGPGHSLAIVREMHLRFPALTFDCTAKIEHLRRHYVLLPELKELGCLFVVSAVESLNDTVLGILEKGHRRQDVEAVLSDFQSAGLALRPTLLPFTPWSSLDDFQDLLDFVEDRDLVGSVDPVQFSVRLLVPPGSRLLDDPALARRLGDLVPASFSHSWVHEDERMERLHRLVSAQVEHSAHLGENPEQTFVRIREIHSRVRGGSRDEARTAPPPILPKRRTPRLTESWFC